MTEYLKIPATNWDDPNNASAYDQLPNWSPYFGEMIFNHIKLRKNMTALDIGFGTGYPLLELSQRLGPTAVVYGIDPWEAAIARAKFKSNTFGIKNIEIVSGDAAAMPFADAQFDLIVSNVGVNNFEALDTVFQECHRVAKPGAQIALTTNPAGHMQEFYTVYEAVLTELGMEDCIATLKAHIEHRHSEYHICKHLRKAGFTVMRTIQDQFSWRFVDGTAFLSCFHIVFGFLPSWKTIVPEDKLFPVFSAIEERLNEIAESVGEFKVTVPVLYIECKK